MLKRIAVVLSAVFVLCAIPVSADEAAVPEPAEVEAVTSASVTDYYSDYRLEGDELMEAVNTPSGFYVISTANEDGTPLAAYFIFSMLKEGDDYYLQLGLAEHQTRINLNRTGEAMAVYAANPEEDAPARYAVSGARMSLELVTDEALVEKLNQADSDTVMFCKVTDVRPLG